MRTKTLTGKQLKEHLENLSKLGKKWDEKNSKFNCKVVAEFTSDDIFNNSDKMKEIRSK